MPFVMKSSQNGFVDPASKTIRFPGRLGPPPNRNELRRRAVFAKFPLDALSLSSLPASANIVNIRDGREAPWFPDVVHDGITCNTDLAPSLSIDFFQHNDSEWNGDIPREQSAIPPSTDFGSIAMIGIPDPNYYQAVIFAPSNILIFASSGFDNLAPDDSEQIRKVRTITIFEHANTTFFTGIGPPFSLTTHPRRRRQAA
jgi:hypothetical protein